MSLDIHNIVGFEHSRSNFKHKEKYTLAQSGISLGKFFILLCVELLKGRGREGINAYDCASERL